MVQVATVLARGTTVHKGVHSLHLPWACTVPSYLFISGRSVQGGELLWLNQHSDCPQRACCVIY